MAVQTTILERVTSLAVNALRPFPCTPVWKVRGQLSWLQGGVRELVLGVDDELLKRPKRSIPRADVAELAVQSLTVSKAANRYAPTSLIGQSQLLLCLSC